MRWQNDHQLKPESIAEFSWEVHLSSLIVRVSWRGSGELWWTTEPLQSKLTLGGTWAQIFVKGPAMIKTTYFLSYLKRRWNMSEWAKIPFVNKINLVLILGTAGDRILLRKNTMILTDCLSRRRPPEGTCRSRTFTTRPLWGRLPNARARSLPCTPWGASAPTRGRRVHSRRWPGRGDPSLVSRSRKRRINNWTWTWGWF